LFFSSCEKQSWTLHERFNSFKEVLIFKASAIDFPPSGPRLFPVFFCWKMSFSQKMKKKKKTPTNNSIITWKMHFNWIG
jgi:hypothetical protein